MNNNDITFKEIDSLYMLALFLGVKHKTLTYILYAKKPEYFYNSFDIPKKTGGVRHIDAPSGALKYVQKNLSQRLIDVQNEHYVKNNTIVHGFTQERNILTNAERHRNKKILVNIDLENFFDCFHFGRVKGYFEKNRYFSLPKHVAICLANLTCYNGKLPQGAPTSPVITNLIGGILDNRISSLLKKYHLIYTRYADDMTFSTNDVKFADKINDFILELNSIIENTGFNINKNKTRVSYKDSRQEVTGIIVNKKLNVKREYYKVTRSMLHHLFCGFPVTKDGNEICIRQLEGRLAFLNFVNDESNIKNNIEKKWSNNRDFNAIEHQYQLFLFYKYFFHSEKPVIITEGKTDHLYIKSALQQFYLKYPSLIHRRNDATYEYQLIFLKRTEVLNKYFGLSADGAAVMKNIYYLYKGENCHPNAFEAIAKFGKTPNSPVILLMDNEQENKDKPLAHFLNKIDQKGCLKEHYFYRICGNLYIATIPLVKNKTECEIEDLFDDELLAKEINGKKLDRSGKKEKALFFNKNDFANYVWKNKENIDFSQFTQVCDSFCEIIEDYNNYVKAQ